MIFNQQIDERVMHAECFLPEGGTCEGIDMPLYEYIK